MKLGFVLGTVFAAIVALSPIPAAAGFVSSVTGDASLVPPPTDSSPGAFQADSFAVWEESSGAILSDSALDHDGTPGAYKGNDDFSAFATTLTTGTLYNATMLHLDPSSRAIGSLTATVNFTSKIIGLALYGASLDASDVYGAPGTTYPTGVAGRGIDLSGNEKFTITVDGQSIQLHFSGNGNRFDQIRVFTASVPEPSSIVVWGVLAALGAVVVCRRPQTGVC